MIRFISYILLAYGLVFGALIWVRGKNEIKTKYLITEGIIYFLCAMGFPDFVMNTYILKRNDWVEDKKLPGTLVATSVTPGALIAFCYLSKADIIEPLTLVCCVISIALGSFTGSHIVTNINGLVIKKIMSIALVVSAGALIFRMILQSGVSVDKYGFTGIELIIACVGVFFLGFINMFGVPMKPSAIVLFLILGMAPISTLTLMLVLGSMSPVAGSINVFKNSNYEPGIASASVVVGTVMAFLGTRFTFQLNQLMLNVILIFIMILTVVVINKKDNK